MSGAPGLSIRWAVALLVAALALADLVYQRRIWWARLRMSHEEVKKEMYNAMTS